MPKNILLFGIILVACGNNLIYFNKDVYTTIEEQLKKNNKVKSPSLFQQFETDYNSPIVGDLLYVPGGIFQRDSTEGNETSVQAFRISKTDVIQSAWTEDNE